MGRSELTMTSSDNIAKVCNCKNLLEGKRWVSLSDFDYNMFWFKHMTIIIEFRISLMIRTNKIYYDFLKNKWTLMLDTYVYRDKICFTNALCKIWT